MSTKERPPAERAQALQSPFVDEEVLTRSPAKEWEPRTSALVSVQTPTQPRDATDPELEADTSFMATEANGAGWTEEEETEDVSEQEYEPAREYDEERLIQVETEPHRDELAQLETALAHLEGQLQEVARELDQLGPETGEAPSPHLEAQLGTLRARLGDLLTPESQPERRCERGGTSLLCPDATGHASPPAECARKRGRGHVESAASPPNLRHRPEPYPYRPRPLCEPGHRQPRASNASIRTIRRSRSLSGPLPSMPSSLKPSISSRRSASSSLPRSTGWRGSRPWTASDS